MTNANSTAIDIDLGRVNVENFDVGQDHNTESFIDLPHSDVLFLDTSHLQHLRAQKFKVSHSLQKDIIANGNKG